LLHRRARLLRAATTLIGVCRALNSVWRIYRDHAPAAVGNMVMPDPLIGPQCLLPETLAVDVMERFRLQEIQRLIMVSISKHA
jgi:hypothetical protein